MKTAGYLPFIVNEIHTTVVATVDDDGLPVTAAIDMMDSDENSRFFRCSGYGGKHGFTET